MCAHYLRNSLQFFHLLTSATKKTHILHKPIKERNCVTTDTFFGYLPTLQKRHTLQTTLVTSATTKTTLQVSALFKRSDVYSHDVIACGQQQIQHYFLSERNPCIPKEYTDYVNARAKYPPMACAKSGYLTHSIFL